MQEKKEIYERCLDFSVRIVNLYKHLLKEYNEQVLSKQLLRSGTSIGANVAEASNAISKRDFLSKMYIAYKEANETLYWIELLFRTDYISEKSYTSIYTDCKIIHKILATITKTTKEHLSKEGNLPPNL